MSNSKLNTNVPSRCEHVPITCSPHRGTLYEPVNYWIQFCKGEATIRLNLRDRTYYYKHYRFSIVDSKLQLNDEFIINIPTKSHISTIERLMLSLGLMINSEDSPKQLSLDSTSFKELLYAFTSLALIDLKVVRNFNNQPLQFKYGEVVFESYLKAIRGKGNISASNQYIRWLNERDTLQLKSKLFNTSGYQAGVNSMIYEPTILANNIIKQLFVLLQSIEFEEIEYTPSYLDFIIPMEVLQELKLRDIMLLLSDCIGYNCGFLIRPKVVDRQYSRVYSSFTSISSTTRQLLGFINYDIGSALQTICLQLVADTSLYPLHKELADNKVEFRSKVVKETGRDIKWVKTELSKIDNLDNMKNIYSKYPLLKEYYNESQILRKEIIESAEPIILSRAKDYAKPKFKKVWVSGQTKPEFIKDGKKESSIFFFIWTQWERQIRESMMSCFDTPEACHQVHDAVYSRQKVDPKILEQKVLKDTGFKVQISTD